MTIARSFSLMLLLALALAVSACNGGGGGTPQVTAISLNPETPAAGSLVELTGTFSGSGAGAATKNWSVSGGSLTLEPPDFALLLRATAKAASATQLTTTQSKVYWLAPPDAGAATITLTVGDSTRSRNVTVGDSPLSLSVSELSGGRRQVTVVADEVTDLYQAAFRVTFSSAWEPASVSQGDFLGAAGDTLFFSLTNQNGFVPVAISRRGNAAGVDGSGTLATMIFEPNAAGASGVRGTSADVGFDLSLVVLRDSNDDPIEF
jgi:hypothetical protein